MEQILDPFDASRARAWPHVLEFIEHLPHPGWLLDLAAGNGRHALAAARRGHPVLAVDVARGLLQRLHGRLHDEPALAAAAACVEADALSLPFADKTIAKAVFAAGLHCIRGQGNRQIALRELHRVLDPGAPVLVTVWWRDPKRFRGPLARTDAALQQEEADGGPPGVPPLEPGDVSLPWRHGVKKSVDRFFHLYLEKELQEDLHGAGFTGVRVRRLRHAATWNLVATLRSSDDG